VAKWENFRAWLKKNPQLGRAGELSQAFEKMKEECRQNGEDLDDDGDYKRRKKVYICRA